VVQLHNNLLCLFCLVKVESIHEVLFSCRKSYLRGWNVMADLTLTNLYLTCKIIYDNINLERIFAGRRTELFYGVQYWL